MLIKRILSMLLLMYCLPSAAQNAKERVYVEPDMKSFMALERAFFMAFEQEDFSGLNDHYTQDEHQKLIRLTTKPELGWGRFWLKPGSQSTFFLQIPHRYFDRFTFDIGRTWRKSGEFRAVMANTVHRNAGSEQQKDFNADFSTAHRSPLLAASRAFMRKRSDATIIQLHGFSNDKRDDERAQKADAILSHGSKLPASRLTRLSKIKNCINKTLALNVLIFPIDSTELGGTQNLVAKSMKQRGKYSGFIHLELSNKLRNKLRDNQEMSLKLMRCIIGKNTGEPNG